MRVSLRDIYVGTRRREDLGNLVEFSEDLRDNGQITAITIRPPTPEEQELGVTQPWVLVAGGRRMAAAALLGWEDIEAYNRESMDEVKHRVLELTENVQRKAMTWQEEVRAKAEIAALRKEMNPDITLAEIAADLGTTKGNLSKDLATAKALEESPSLANAASKRAAHGAAQLIKEGELRLQRITMQHAERPDFSASIEDKIHTEDAVRLWERLAPRSVDLALLDGPYGMDFWSTGQKMDEGDTHLSEYDDSFATTEDLYRRLFPPMVRAMRETGWIAMFCGMETLLLLRDLAQDCCATHGAYRHNQYPKQCTASVGHVTQEECRFLVPEVKPWIWYKPNARNNPRYKDRHAKDFYEFLFLCNMGKGRITRWPCGNILIHDVEYDSQRTHANQKPISLYCDIIERFTFTGDRVVDSFAGSHNSLAAAAKLQRDFEGGDSNPDLRSVGIARVKHHFQPISPAAIRESYERYKQGLEGSGEGVTDFRDADESSLGVCACGVELFEGKNGMKLPSGMVVHLGPCAARTAKEATA